MLKDAPHRSSAAFPFITMGQMVRHTGLSPKKIIFLRVDYLEKCQCVVHMAYLELIRQLVHVPHRTSIALSFFSMTLTAGLMGQALKEFFFQS